jgi:hypothetical protein
MAAADGDGGAVVISRARLATVLAALSLTACATAWDTTRDGQPVVATSIAQIENDPAAWEGKWVRLEGRIDDKASLLLDADGDVMFLEPQIKLLPDKPNLGDAVKRATVSGEVDLTCWAFWKKLNAPKFDDEGDQVLIHVMVPAEFAYCPGGRPNLVNVLVSTPSEGAP